MRSGSLEIIEGASLPETRELQDRFTAAKADRVEQQASQQQVIDLDPHENEPGPPVSQTPCEICGGYHRPEGPLVCICIFCSQRKEIFHAGACQSCVESRYGHYYQALGIPISEQTVQKKQAWEL